MQRNYGLVLSFFLVFASALTGYGQASADVGIKANFAGGEVTAVSDGKISLATMDGAIEVVITDKSVFKKISPENPSLKAAVDSQLSEIAVGDKLLVTGMVSEDKKSIPAKTVYLMTKASITQKLSKEQEDWRVRGTFGSVVSVDAMTNDITVSVRGAMGAPARNVLVKPGADTEYARYAPDSIEFAKALKSKISDIEKGDEIRVLGTKNADGSEVTAEQIVTGSFKTTSGTIKSIDQEKGQVTISDVVTKKDVTVTIIETSILKQFPAEMAQRLAQFQMMQAMGQGGLRPPTGGQQNPQTTPQQRPQVPPQQNPQANPQQRTPGQFPGGGMGQGLGPRGGVDDAKFPLIKLADLKVGEIIGVLSTKPNDPVKIRAIKLFSGVEPFIKAAQAQAAMGGGGQRGGGGANSGFTIPGLDGFGTP